MIQKVKVKGLFHRFNYELDFDNSPIKFITAPNGYGKTTILNAIDFLFEEQWKDLCSIVFDKIELVLSDANVLIEKKNTIVELDENEDSDEENDERKIHSVLSVTLDGKLCVIVTCDFDEEGNIVGRTVVKKTEAYKNIFRLYKNNQKHLYIAESRLYQSPKDVVKNHLFVVNSNENEFRPWLTGLLDEVRRILAAEETKNYLFDDDNTCDLKNFWNSLKKFGLVNESENICSDAKLRMLKKVLGDDVTKLNLFSIIVEQCEFTNKKMTIDPKYGFIFRLDDENKSILDLSYLSSGEKQLLTIVYRLLFDKNVEEDSIVLIDEPEISFHMSWQVMFLKALKLIRSSKPMQFIVATHSPQMFELNFNNAIDLFELSERNDARL